MVALLMKWMRFAKIAAVDLDHTMEVHRRGPIIIVLEMRGAWIGKMDPARYLCHRVNTKQKMLRRVDSSNDLTGRENNNTNTD